MTNRTTILIWALGLMPFASCAQNKKAIPADKFLSFLNHYQVDSLQNTITDNFHLLRTFTTYTDDKKSFIGSYIPTSKNLHATYKVIMVTHEDRSAEYLVEDHSDYYKYLKIDYPQWQIQVLANREGRIERMIIDTTATYSAYCKQMKEKVGKFKKWLEDTYPQETDEQLYNTPRLLAKRLKEYATQ